MKLNRFCAKCGRNVNEQACQDGLFLCEDCRGNTPLELDLPKQLILKLCKSCGAFSLRKDEQDFEWSFRSGQENDADFITQLLYEQIFGKIEKKKNLHIEFFFKPDFDLKLIQDFPLILEVKSQDQLCIQRQNYIIRYKMKFCPHCAKKIGGRFDAVLQIRIQHIKDNDRLGKIIELCHSIENEEQMKNPENFVTKYDLVTNGYDLKVSNNNILRVLVAKLRKAYDFQWKHSKKLMGIDTERGTELYRQSILLKLLPVQKGDKILIDNIEYNVKKISNNKISFENAKTKKIEIYNISIFEKKKWLLFN